jgi:hypothetical protein
MQLPQGSGSVTFVTINGPVKLLFPALCISSLPKNAIGFSYPRGKDGFVVGLALLTCSALIATVFSHVLGPAALMLVVWPLGTTSALMLYSAASGGVAFVKPLCTSCRLLPIIQEHEAMHLRGVHSDRTIWNQAKKKYSTASLRLEGDQSICNFCPIARRLAQA